MNRWVVTQAMTGQLVTLPVRLGVRSARLMLHAAEDLTGLALEATLRVAGVVGNLVPGGRPSPGAASWPASQPPTPERPTPTPSTPSTPRPASSAPQSDVPAPDPRIARRASAERAPAAAPAPTNGAGAEELASRRLEREGTVAPIDLEATSQEPAHVSEQPVLVRESASPGAEDGAGASIHVQQPWEGYEHMNARAVIARLSGASAAELAAVQLYEGMHRRRQTVMAAVERQLRTGGAR